MRSERLKEKDKDLARKIDVMERNPLKGRKKKYLISFS